MMSCAIDYLRIMRTATASAVIACGLSGLNTRDAAAQTQPTIRLVFYAFLTGISSAVSQHHSLKQQSKRP